MALTGKLYNIGAFRFILTERVKDLHRQKMDKNNQETYKQVELKARISEVEHLLREYNQNEKEQLGV